jgi:hypothetical protein
VRHFRIANGESESERQRRAESRCFWVTGQRGLTYAEAATAIVDEARRMVETDLGVAIDWTSASECQAIGNSLKGDLIRVY